LHEARSKFEESANAEIASAQETIQDDDKLTKQYLEAIKGTIEPIDVHGDFALSWTTGPYTVRVVFPKDAEEANEQEEDDMEEFGSDGERHGDDGAREVKARNEDDEDVTDEDSGAAPKFNPHSFHIDIKTAGSPDVVRINATAAKDGTCVIETVAFPDLAKEEKFKQGILDGKQPFSVSRSDDFQGDVLSLADLTEEMATNFFSLLERLRIDDELAQFVQHYSLYASRAQHVALLKSLKSKLIPK